MNQKSLISLFSFALFTALAFAACGGMLLIPDVNQYVGVGIGAGICIAASLLYAFSVRKEGAWHRAYAPIFVVNALGSGLAASSLFVYMKTAPAWWEYAAAWGLLCGIYFLYCLLTYIPLLRWYPGWCMVVYAVLVSAAVIALACVFQTPLFVLSALFLLAFYGFFVALVMHSGSCGEQFERVTGASCFSIAVIVIVVLLIISEGSGLDGADFTPDGSSRRRKGNPYSFETW